MPSDEILYVGVHVVAYRQRQLSAGLVLEDHICCSIDIDGVDESEHASIIEDYRGYVAYLR